MGLMDKILDVMKLDPDDDFEYDDDFELDEEPAEKPAFKTKKAEERVVEDTRRSRERAPKAGNKITPIRSGRNNRGGTDMEVCVIKPSAIEDERDIVDTLLDGRTVVLNVEGLAVDIAQRIIDFSSGSCYALGGNLQKISNYIFIITPSNVDISGDFSTIMDGFDVNTFKSEF
ncbi:MAG: cell division protein SepF [Lachnospiraceae bacterium]|nr:cell division protein SepF [Lachnospiraceae bacterium]